MVAEQKEETAVHPKSTELTEEWVHILKLEYDNFYSISPYFPVYFKM